MTFKTDDYKKVLSMMTEIEKQAVTDKCHWEHMTRSAVIEEYFPELIERALGRRSLATPVQERYFVIQCWVENPRGYANGYSDWFATSGVLPEKEALDALMKAKERRPINRKDWVRAVAASQEAIDRKYGLPE